MRKGLKNKEQTRVREYQTYCKDRGLDHYRPWDRFKFSLANTIEHELTAHLIAMEASRNMHPFMAEATFKLGGIERRADILEITPTGPVAHEVAHSEGYKSLEEKQIDWLDNLGIEIKCWKAMKMPRLERVI